MFNIPEAVSIFGKKKKKRLFSNNKFDGYETNLMQKQNQSSDNQLKFEEQMLFNKIKDDEPVGEKLSLLQIALGRFQMGIHSLYSAKAENPYLEGEITRNILITKQKITYKNQKSVLLLLQDVTAYNIEKKN